MRGWLKFSFTVIRVKFLYAVWNGSDAEKAFKRGWACLDGSDPSDLLGNHSLTSHSNRPTQGIN